MLKFSEKNPNSHLTVKKRKYLSFPSRFLLENNYLKGKVLDFGCGLGKDVEILSQQGINIVGYDPFYFNSFPKEKFDTIICNYVLNVLLPEEQAAVLMQISESLKPKGKCFISVRRDIKRNGFRFNPNYGCKVYQCNVKLPYKSICLKEHCEIYSYEHYTQNRESKNECRFCSPKGEDLITESATCYSIFERNSEIKGSAFVIPKIHTSNYFDLSLHHQIATLMVIEKTQQVIFNSLKPKEINVKFSLTKDEKIRHSFIQLIPIF
ncbi:MAG: class I SAM-dependent methyltransferase [Calditrichaeota bacterium]|nr:MAG: class I SAM-dependent methyltransferase [Calditrichota bacterium]